METMTKQFELKHATILDNGEWTVWGIYDGYKLKVSLDRHEDGETFEVLLMSVNHVDVQRDEACILGDHKESCIVGVTTSREEICSLMCKALDGVNLRDLLKKGLMHGIKDYAERLDQMTD